MESTNVWASGSLNPKKSLPVTVTDKPARPFYAIQSSLAVVALTSIIKDQYAKYLEKNGKQDLLPVCLMTSEFRDGLEKNVTISVFDPKIYRFIKENAEEILEFKIQEYTLHKSKAPGEGMTYNFFIPFPHFLSLDQCQSHLLGCLKNMILYGLLTQKDYKIIYPHSNRSDNTHGGCCYVQFEDNVDKEVIMLTRIFINGTKWNQDSPVQCKWCKPRESKPNSSSDLSGSEKEYNKDPVKESVKKDEKNPEKHEKKEKQEKKSESPDDAGFIPVSKKKAAHAKADPLDQIKFPLTSNQNTKQ